MSDPTAGGPTEPPNRDPGRPTVEHGAGGDRDPHRPTREAERPPQPPQPPPDEELPDHLPAELDALISDRWQPEGLRGGQARISRAIWRADGTQVAVKVFHDVRPDLESVWDRWRQAEHENIIPLLYAANHRYHAYEVTPFARHGSLIEHFNRDRPLDPDRAEAVLRQIGSALNHIHATTPQWLHLDIKPANILVTSLDPFTVTLADFGVSRLQEYTRDHTANGVKTLMYSAPEAFRGVRAASLDWWALGMTLLEAMNGRHPFHDDEEGDPSYGAINDQVNEHDVPIESVPGRWIQPLTGLLTRDPARRWTFEQIAAWLAGRTVPEQEPEPLRASFTFAGRQVSEARELAALMAGNWTAAGDLLSGTWNRMLTWAEAVSPELATALRTVETDYAVARRPIDRTVCEVIARLDPRAVPVFRGRPAHRDALLDVLAVITEMGSIAEHTEELAWIAGLYDTRALVALSRHDGHDELATADENWLRWFDRAQEALRRCRIDPIQVPAYALLQPMLLAAALDRGAAEGLRDRAEASVNRRNRRVRWFAGLRSSAQPPDEPAYHAVMILTAALAAEPPPARANNVAPGPVTQVPDEGAPGEAARQLRQQVDDMLDAAGGGAWPGPNAPDRERLVPATPYPYRPPYDLPPPPHVGGARVAIAAALLALTATVGTALQTSMGEGIAVGAVLVAAAAVLGLSSRWRRNTFASGLLGAIAGGLCGAPVAAGLGWVADLVAGHDAAWPVFWTSWMLAVFAAAVLGSSPTTTR